MVEGCISPFALKAGLSEIWDDLDLWFEAIGERRLRHLREAERLGLECWLWEMHDRARSSARRVPEQPLHERPDEELSVRGWSRGSNLAEEKALRHLGRAGGLRDQLRAEHEHDGLGDAWDVIEAIFRFRKALGRSLRSTRDGRIRLLILDGKRKQCLTAWPASKVRPVAITAELGRLYRGSLVWEEQRWRWRMPGDYDYERIRDAYHDLSKKHRVSRIKLPIPGR